MNMKWWLGCCIPMFIIGCSNKQQISNTDTELEANIINILQDKLTEIDGISGKVIVMGTDTKVIKAMVGLEQDSTEYKEISEFEAPQETGLFSLFSTIAALESGKVKYDDTFDTGNGILVCDGDMIKDHNWQRGGYGELNVEQGIGVNSNIMPVKEVLQAFKDDPQDYLNEMNKLGFKIDASNKLHYAALGYGQKITPIQLIKLYNEIANDSLPVSQPTIQNIKRALEMCVKEGLDKPAYSDKVRVAGRSGSIQVSDSVYRVEFCGYFPADKPEYTILVTIDKVNLPVSGGLMAGDVFRKIVDDIIEL